MQWPHQIDNIGPEQPSFESYYPCRFIPARLSFRPSHVIIHCSVNVRPANRSSGLKTPMHVTNGSMSFVQAEEAREVQRIKMQQREEAAQAAEAAALADLSGQRQVQVQKICVAFVPLGGRSVLYSSHMSWETGCVSQYS
jgi:hypothetical protein